MKIIIVCLVIINILFSSFWVFNKNIFFHTDIARDFLLIEDIVENKNLALIGPRSGAVPGLFHGPLWLYLNLPAYLLGGGDPIIVGWFWVVIFAASVFFMYVVAKRMFGVEAGLLSALLLSSITALSTRNMFNPVGALIVAPLFFYLLYIYLKDKKILHLTLSIFILGIIIQFQMAFGVPILILVLPLIVWFTFKNRKINHLAAFLIIFLPLSTFLLFDLRNNFLQFNSVLSYTVGEQSHGKLGLDFTQMMTLRLKELITEGFGLITKDNTPLNYLLLAAFIYPLYRVLRKDERVDKVSYFLFLYLYLGFWIISILFKGPMWDYYILPFIPIVIITLISFKKFMHKFLFYAILIALCGINIQSTILDLKEYRPNPLNQSEATWQFNKLVAEKVFADKEEEFGYFIFTPDLYGYGPRYALNLFDRKSKNKKAYPFQKKEVTYLIIAPPPLYGRDPNSLWYQRNTNSYLWKMGDVRISRPPDELTSFPNGFSVEKYYLSPDEIKVEPNQFLIKGIFFR